MGQEKRTIKQGKSHQEERPERSIQRVPELLQNSGPSVLKLTLFKKNKVIVGTFRFSKHPLYDPVVGAKLLLSFSFIPHFLDSKIHCQFNNDIFFRGKRKFSTALSVHIKYETAQFQKY